MSLNEASARLSGRERGGARGPLLAEAGIDGYAGRLWAAGTRARPRRRPRPEPARPSCSRSTRPDRTRTIEATLTRLDVHDVTGGLPPASRLSPRTSPTARPASASPPSAAISPSRPRPSRPASSSASTATSGPADDHPRLCRSARPRPEPGEPEQIRDVIARRRTISSRHSTRPSRWPRPPASRSRSCPSTPSPSCATPSARAVRRAQRGVEIAFDAAVAERPADGPDLVGRIVRAISTRLSPCRARRVDTRLSDAATASSSTWASAKRPTRETKLCDRPSRGPPGGAARRAPRRRRDVPPSAAWRRTVRLPRHAAVVVDLPPESISPEALHSRSLGHRRGLARRRAERRAAHARRISERRVRRATGSMRARSRPARSSAGPRSAVGAALRGECRVARRRRLQPCCRRRPCPTLPIPPSSPTTPSQTSPACTPASTTPSPSTTSSGRRTASRRPRAASWRACATRRTAFRAGRARSTSTSSGTMATRPASRPRCTSCSRTSCSPPSRRSSSALETPVTGGLVNPDPQRDDVPHRLHFGDDTRPHAGQVVGDH